MFCNDWNGVDCHPGTLGELVAATGWVTEWRLLREYVQEADAAGFKHFTQTGSAMIVEPANISHLGSWAHLRNALWPRMSASEHQRDIQTAFFSNAKSTVAFVAIGGGELIGFAEASLRHDYVNGCETSPVAFLEGIYVAAANRRQGVAKALCAAVEEWGRNQGCVEFASDTSLGNDVSQRLHAALGFEETQRVIFFRKRIGR